MKPMIFLLLGFFWANSLHSQFIDNFDDGDFSSNPAWLGNTDQFIVNENGELQLQNNAPNSSNTSYLSVAATTSLDDSTTWEFLVRLEFAASTSNFARVYLNASQPDLSSDLNGYFVKIGGISGSDDALELYRQDGNRSTLLLSGKIGAIGGDPVLVRVRMTRNALGVWQLWADYAGNSNFQLEGSVTDNTYSAGNYFGIYCRYTSTRGEAFFFDDIYVNPLYIDKTPPQLLTAEALSATELELTFDEPLDANVAQNITNYSINKGIGNPANAVLVSPTVVFLELNTPLQGGVVYNITASNISDLNGNVALAQPAEVIFYDIQPIGAGDMVINEVLFNPATGGEDFVELYNISNKTFNLNGLEIINTQKTSGNTSQKINTDFLLLPNAYIAITGDPQDIIARYQVEDPQTLFKHDLPTLDDNEGNVTIRSAGVTIDSFDYSDDLHSPLLSDKNGVSLERIDPHAPTQSSGNWHSAASTVGFATPGYQNSQFFAQGNIVDKFFSITNKTFSPDGDGFEDVLLLEYNAEQPGMTANIRIFDAKGRLVKRLIDNELLPANGIFKWDGTTDDLTKARIGIYIIWIELIDPNGRIEHKKETCVLAGKLN